MQYKQYTLLLFSLLKRQSLLSDALKFYNCLLISPFVLFCPVANKSYSLYLKIPTHRSPRGPRHVYGSTAVDRSQVRSQVSEKRCHLQLRRAQCGAFLTISDYLSVSLLQGALTAEPRLDKHQTKPHIIAPFVF